jgi:outer membrane protein TolC
MRAERIRVSIVVLTLLAGLACGPAWSQGSKTVDTKPSADYRSGHPWWTAIGPYKPMFVSEVQLANSPRVEQIIQDGKLMLSLEDAISLALENNLDISVQRFGPWIADTGVLRAKAGQGTAAQSFDPVVTAFYLASNRNTPVSNPFLAGTGTAGLSAFNSHTTQANFAYSQGFVTGTSAQVTFNNTRSSSSSPAELFNPSVTTSLTFSFQQPLLDGFGFTPNRRFLRIARNNKRIADLLFQDQVINTVSAVQQLYWDLVFAREDVKVKQRSVELAQRLYNDNKRQVEIGTLAPIEVVRAEAEVARTNQDLIVSQTFLLQQQTLIKNAITKNSMDPAVLNAEVVPTDSITKPAAQPVMPLQDAVTEAWEKRPDVRQQRIDLENRKITTRASRNALLPSLTLGGQFGGTGLAGNTRTTTSTAAGFAANTASPLVDASGNIVLVGGQPVFAGRQLFTTTTAFGQAGFADAFGIAKDFAFPNYALTLNLNIPIRNRAAQADNAQAQLEERQSETRLRQLQNGIVVQVRNSQIALEQNQARVDAAIKSRELQERTLDAEQKKYQLGASSIFLVIQAQRDLAQAQSAEVRALADLIKARVEFERTLGRTLDTNRITLAEAKKGSVTREANIPGHVVGGPAVTPASQY